MVVLASLLQCCLTRSPNYHNAAERNLNYHNIAPMEENLLLSWSPTAMEVKMPTPYVSKQAMKVKMPTPYVSKHTALLFTSSNEFPTKNKVRDTTSSRSRIAAPKFGSVPDVGNYRARKEADLNGLNYRKLLNNWNRKLSLNQKYENRHHTNRIGDKKNIPGYMVRRQSTNLKHVHPAKSKNQEEYIDDNVYGSSQYENMPVRSNNYHHQSEAEMKNNRIGHLRKKYPDGITRHFGAYRWPLLPSFSFVRFFRNLFPRRRPSPISTIPQHVHNDYTPTAPVKYG